ncbi:MAG: LysM peptidoglycan-binding domain-containing protein [Acidimicrobiales bacterium]
MHPRDRPSFYRSSARLTVGVTAVAVFIVGVPTLLWWGTGGGLLPAPGPGGWAEVRAQLTAGQLPAPAVLAVAAIAGWLLWIYLMLMIVVEIVAGWRERDQATSRVDQLSGPRRLIARLVGWVFAGHTMLASVLITPQLTAPQFTPVVAIVDDSVGVAPVATGPRPVEPAGGFDPHAYVDFDPDLVAVGPAPRQETVDREVVRGDTLWDLAQELTGDGMNWPALWAATDLDAQNPPVDPHNPDLIFPGNVVRIPIDLLADPPPNSNLSSASSTEQPADAVPPGSLPDTPDQPGGSSQALLPPLSNPPNPTGTPDAPVDDAAQGTGNGATVSTGTGGAPVVAVAVAGLGVAASAVILAGVKRRRRQAMAASGRGQRPPKRTRRDIRASQRLMVSVSDTMWGPEELTASWNALRPVDPGSRQPWCVRWNSALRVLECAWTPDPATPHGTPSDPPEPGSDSPWRLVEKHDRAGRPVAVWTITEHDVPQEVGPTVVPAMVGCADGRQDRPSGDGFFINLEAAGIISVESSKPDLIEPEGVVRALLLQLHANAAARVHLLNTDLGLGGLDHTTLHHDPIALENELVAELTGRQDLWDDVPSMFVARSARTFTGPITVVVGASEELQSCSHLLSLARAENTPLVVIGIGALTHAWASFHLEPEPDKHTIRFPAARAVLSFDHLSWASTTDAADLVELFTASSRPWIYDPDPRPDLIDMDPAPAGPGPWTPQPANKPDLDLDLDGGCYPDDERLSFEPDRYQVGSDDDLLTGDRPGVSDDGGWGPDHQKPEPEPRSATNEQWAERAATGGPRARSSNASPASGSASEAPSAVAVDVLNPVQDWSTQQGLAEPEPLDDLWSQLPEADPTTLGDRAPLDSDDIDWAVVGDDTVVDELLDSTLDELLTDDWADADSDDHSELVVVSPWLAGDSGPANRAHDVDLARSAVSNTTAQNCASRQATVRLGRSVVTSVVDPASAPDDHDDDDDDGNDEYDGDVSGRHEAGGEDDGEASEGSGRVRPDVALPATTDGLRLEICGPIRLMRSGPDQTELIEVPVGAAGLTAAQLALLAYLVIAARPTGGVGREQIAFEFWPDAHGDGTSRLVQPATVKRRVGELRGRLSALAAGIDGKALLPEAVDGRYRLCLSNDWQELRDALVNAESSTPGSGPWTQAVAVITSIVRPPGLLTPLTGSRHGRNFAWIDDHYQSLIQDVSRRVTVILADQAQAWRHDGDHKQALEILNLARSISPIYPREIADGVVATYLALGDPVRAEQECLLYERQFDDAFAARERGNPQPGNPRVRLNDYLNHHHNP